MNPITLYLEKFKGILSSDSSLKRIIQETVKAITGKTIEEAHITIKDNNAVLKVSPTLRSVLFINREKITEAVQKEALKTVRVR